MKHHTTAEYEEIKLKDLEISHLKNIINMIERKSEKGCRVVYNTGNMYLDDPWIDEEILYGEEAKKYLNYDDYKRELKRRNKEQIKHHMTADGREIKIKDLEDSHLLNIVNMIKRKAKEGFNIVEMETDVVSGGSCYYEDILYGEDVEKLFNYESYRKELKRRFKKLNKKR